MATGTVTVTETTHRRVKKIKVAWTCTSAGAAADTTTAYYNGIPKALVTVPSATAAPADDYDITITDTDSVDVLAGQGANRDTANTEYVTSGFIPVTESQLTFTVANAGDVKSGTIYLLVE